MHNYTAERTNERTVGHGRETRCRQIFDFTRNHYNDDDDVQPPRTEARTARRNNRYARVMTTGYWVVVVGPSIRRLPRRHGRVRVEITDSPSDLSRDRLRGRDTAAAAAAARRTVIEGATGGAARKPLTIGCYCTAKLTVTRSRERVQLRILCPGST